MEAKTVAELDEEFTRIAEDAISAHESGDQEWVDDLKSQRSALKRHPLYPQLLALWETAQA